jgi:hypothetical protein
MFGRHALICRCSSTELNQCEINVDEQEFRGL